MGKFSQLSYHERQKIYTGLIEGRSQKNIAYLLGGINPRYHENRDQINDTLFFGRFNIDHLITLYLVALPSPIRCNFLSSTNFFMQDSTVRSGKPREFTASLRLNSFDSFSAAHCQRANCLAESRFSTSTFFSIVNA